MVVTVVVICINISRIIINKFKKKTYQKLKMQTCLKSCHCAHLQAFFSCGWMHRGGLEVTWRRVEVLMVPVVMWRLARMVGGGGGVARWYWWCWMYA